MISLGLKNLKYRNEELSVKKDSTEKDSTRGYPHLEKEMKM